MARLLPKREKYWRGLRYERLPYRGFFAWEAETLKRFPMTRSYMKRLIRARRQVLLKAIREGWTPGEYRHAVHAEYEMREWFDERGRPSVYKMIKFYRKVSIDLGEYTPPPPRKRGPLDYARWKGDVETQKRRWRASHREQIARSKRRWREERKGREATGRVVFDEGLGRFVVVPA